MLESNSQYPAPKQPSRVGNQPSAAQFWSELARDAERIREQLLQRASRSDSPIEKKRLEKLADCAMYLCDILQPGGGQNRV